MIKRLLLSFAYISILTSLSGQCPDRTFLWNRIVYLRDSSQESSKDQLVELKTYLSKQNDCSIRNDSVEVLLISRIGWLLSTQGDYKSAIAFTNKSIDMIHAHVNTKNIHESQLIKCYNNLRIMYDSTNQEMLKNRSIDSCISLVVRLQTGYQYAFEIVNSKIEKLFEKGDYFNCINYATLGEFIAAKAGYLDQDALYYTTWKINSLIYLNQYDEASEMIAKGMTICTQSGNKKYLGTLLGLKAIISEERGDVKQALLFTNQSVKYNREVSNFSACSSVLANLGYKLFFVKLHQYDKALEYYHAALKYANSDYAVEILDNIAIVYLQIDDYQNAFDYFHHSFEKIYPGANENNIVELSGEELLQKVSADYVMNLSINKGTAYLKKYKQQSYPKDLDAALNSFKAAERLAEKIKMVQTEFASKLFWRTNTRRLYENAIESSYLSGNLENAFYFFEKSRAVLLNDQLQEQEAGDTTISEMAIVKKNILRLEKETLSVDPSSKEYANVQQTLFANKEQLARLDKLFKEKNPWYYQSLLDTNFISLKEIQNRLLADDKAQTILEFFNGDSAIYLLTVTSKKTNISKIDKKDFENKVVQYSNYLSDPELENQNYTGFVKTGSQLFNLIFKGTQPPEGRIIVSPDGKYFPLEALVTNQNFSAPEYLLKNNMLSYTYSIRFLLNDFKKNNSSSIGTFLGFAPVSYPSGFQLASLSASDVSLEKIIANFKGSRLLSGPQASRNNFMQNFHAYKIIQLYTHASDSSSNNGEPVIYFADSALYLSELIPENKTATQLIVLSACETGNGKLFKGEGVFSFNRGFAALGIPSSVINLWSVDDGSTYKLTELFYKYVGKGLPLDESLRKAKLDFIASSSKEKKLPYYWSAAILAGQTDPVVIQHGISWGGIALVTGSLIFILMFFFKKRNAGKQLRM
jgi:CHAT domain-containing protein